jgi:hypothetical protein
MISQLRARNERSYSAVVADTYSAWGIFPANSPK